MNFRFWALGACAAAASLLAVAASNTPADAQQRQRASAGSPNVSYQQGPRTRIFVSRRNWLDLGTEVSPGERKYTDYAIPPSYTRTTVDHLTGRPWMRHHLPDPFDLPGYPKGGYGY